MAGLGKPKTGGRRKGTPNRIPQAVKEAVLEAFERKGGVAYLERLADEDPRTFAALLGKLIPSELRAEVSGSSVPIVIVSGIAAPSPGSQVDEVGSARGPTRMIDTECSRELDLDGPECAEHREMEIELS